MSRARDRKEQETEAFFLQNPELRPQPENIDLGTFDWQLGVGTRDVTVDGTENDVDDAFVPIALLDGPGSPTVDLAIFGLRDADTGVGTTIGGAGTAQLFIESFQSSVDLDQLTAFNQLEEDGNVGLTGNGYGILSEEEFVSGGGDFLADGFDTINGNEVLQTNVVNFTSNPPGTEFGFNFLVEGGTGTVELVMVDDGPAQGIDFEALAQFSTPVGPGQTQGNLQGMIAPGYDYAYIGVTGDVEITVVGIGLSGDFTVGGGGT